jgi:hypothetical protein
MFLQVATKFATVRNVFSPSQPIRRAAEDKIAALRRLDKSRAWNSLDDRLYCTICKHEISGRQIEVVGGTNGLSAQDAPVVGGTCTRSDEGCAKKKAQMARSKPLS